MSNALLTPDSITDFQAALRHGKEQGGHVVVCGSQSKTRIVSSAATTISTTSYAGIVDHQASDFTITARAGTLVRDLCRALDKKGQHLPFDPTFVDRNATIGGLVAAGMNGPCRLRFGGIRDFIIGCEFLDGNATVVRGGGRVVKNAAGFDIPKFLVGSAGRFGLLLEVTFKVFPRPKCYRTLRFETGNLESSVVLMQTLHKALEFEAIDIVDSTTVFARASGEDESVLDATEQSVRAASQQDLHVLSVEEDQSTWAELANCSSLPDSSLLLKVPMTQKRILDFDQLTNGQRVRYSVAGNVAVLQLRSHEDLATFEAKLWQCGLAAQTIVGPSDLFLHGDVQGLSYLRKVKSALDPNDVFAALNMTPNGVAT